MDISAFVILLLVALLMFGLPMLMLDFSRITENAVVAHDTDSWIFDALLNQYYLSLGEFNTDNFAHEREAYLCFLLFFFATYFTQVVMMNMMIAIMGDTFGKVMENRELQATRTKLDILQDYVPNIRCVSKSSTVQDKKVFMFVVTPEQDDQDVTENWEGTVNRMKSF